MDQEIIEIYFVRHGESIDNAQSIPGRPEAPLTEKGVQQAQTIAVKLQQKDIDFTHVLTSKLERAVATAEEIADALKLNVEKTDLLNEMDYGDFATRPWPEFASATPAELKQAGVESDDSIYERCHSLVELLQEDHRKPLIVGHEVFTRNLLLHFCPDYSDVNSWKEVDGLKNGELYEFVINTDRERK